MSKGRQGTFDRGPSHPTALSRRGVLKGAAAAAGAATGSEVIGAPIVWAQELKNIELRHIGVSYWMVKEIGDQASKDLGFKVSMQNLDTSAAITRFITQPLSVDIPDMEGWQTKVAVPHGILQGIEVKKIKEFDNILPIFTKGEYEGKKVSRQGISPYEAMYIASKDSTKIVEGVHDYMTFLPQVYNADSIGYRPDIVKHTVTKWKDLIDPVYKGRSAILDVPNIGIMDAALALESRGDIVYKNKGNMTRHEIDVTIDALIALKKNGQFRATWTTFEQSVELMASGEVVIQSMWSPAVTAVLAKGIPHLCARQHRDKRQGGVSRLVQRHGADAPPDRPQARSRLRISQLVLCRLAGRLCRPARLLQPGAENRGEIHDAQRIRLLVFGQAGNRRDQGPVRRTDRQGRGGP